MQIHAPTDEKGKKRKTGTARDQLGGTSPFFAHQLGGASIQQPTLLTRFQAKILYPTVAKGKKLNEKGEKTSF